MVVIPVELLLDTTEIKVSSVCIRYDRVVLEVQGVTAFCPCPMVKRKAVTGVHKQLVAGFVNTDTESVELAKNQRHGKGENSGCHGNCFEF